MFTRRFYTTFSCFGGRVLPGMAETNLERVPFGC
jgi:hypothetical protein